MATTKENYVSSKMRDQLYFRIRTRLGNIAASIRECLAAIRDRLLLILGMDSRFVKPEKCYGDSIFNFFGSPNEGKNSNCDVNDELSIEKRIQCMLRCCFRGCDVDAEEENSYVFNNPSNRSPRLKSHLRRKDTRNSLSGNTLSGDGSTHSTPKPNRRRRGRNTKMSPTSFRLWKIRSSPIASDHQQADSCGNDKQNLPSKKDKCGTEGSRSTESHATNIKQVRLLFDGYGSDSHIQKKEENGNNSNPILARAYQIPDAIMKSYQSLSSEEGDCKSRIPHSRYVLSNIHGTTKAHLDNFRFEESFAEPELIINDEQSFIRICPGVGKLSFAQMLEILNRLLQDYTDACVKVSLPNSDKEICVSSEYSMEHPCIQESPQREEQLKTDHCTKRELMNEKKKEDESLNSKEDSKVNKNNAQNWFMNVSDNQISLKRTQPPDLNILANMQSESVQIKTVDKNMNTSENKLPSNSQKSTVPLSNVAKNTNSPTPQAIPPTQESNKTKNMENSTATDNPVTKNIIQNMESVPIESSRNMNLTTVDISSPLNKQNATTERDSSIRKGTLVDKETKVNNTNTNKICNNASQTKDLKNSKPCNRSTTKQFFEEGSDKLKVFEAVNEREKKADGQPAKVSNTPFTQKKENPSDKYENKTPRTPLYNHPSCVKLQLLQKKISELERVEEREKHLQHVEKLRNQAMPDIQAHHKRTNETTNITSKQTADLFDSDSSEDESTYLNTNVGDEQNRVRKNREYMSISSDDSDNEVECNFKGKAKSTARESSVLPDYEYYEDLHMSAETEKLTEERVINQCGKDYANGVRQSPGKFKNSPDENSKQSEPWRRRIVPLYQNDGAFELASHYRIDGRVEAEMSKRGSREKTFPHKEKKKRRGVPNRHLRKEDKSNLCFDEEQFHEVENANNDASYFINEDIGRNLDNNTDIKVDTAMEIKPVELVEDTRHFEQIPMEVIIRKAKDDDDIDNKYAVRGRMNDGGNRDKRKKRQRTQSQKPILVCALPTPHKTKP